MTLAMVSIARTLYVATGQTRDERGAFCGTFVARVKASNMTEAKELLEKELPAWCHVTAVARMPGTWGR